MKKSILFLTVAAICLAGCGKQAEPETTAVTAAEPAPEAQAVADAQPEPMPEPTPEPVLEPTPAAGLYGMAKALKGDMDSAAPSAPAGSTSALASQLDWNNLSWDDVPEVPYVDKAKLVEWATSQADGWKSKLTSAVKDQGLGMLGSLGDSGWQGSLKQVMDSVNGLKDANPETWEMAKGALISAWDRFEVVAGKVLEK